MAFWSSQRLMSRLAEIVPSASKEAVDCNAVTLTLGREIYVTPNVEELETRTVIQLGPGEPFVLPPNQFAFLMTEEHVQIPRNAMALISMKATFKMMGLINVSGFHVDPGYSGPLTFSVYNAGPSPVHLRRGMRLFLIWFADLDANSERAKETPAGTSMNPAWVNRLSGTTNSVPALEERLRPRLEALEKGQALLKVLFAGLATAALAIGGALYPLFLAPFYKQVDSSADREQKIYILPAPQPTLPSASAAKREESDRSTGTKR